MNDYPDLRLDVEAEEGCYATLYDFFMQFAIYPKERQTQKSDRVH